MIDAVIADADPEQFGNDPAVASARSVLRGQLALAWRFAGDFVLDRIDEDIALWSPGGRTCTVHGTPDGWLADWPDEEHDPPASATIGWILWHIEWWWGSTLRLVRGGAALAPHKLRWSGGTDRIAELHREWDEILADDDPARLTPWLGAGERPLAEVAAWVNFELAKNLAEINQLLMLRAARDDTPHGTPR